MSARPNIPRWMKETLPHKCGNCGSTKGLVYHHIVPVEVGGNDVLSNIAVLCSNCHSLVHHGKNGVIDHGYLVSEGMKAAKARGVSVGKKPVDRERIYRMIAENSTQFNDVYSMDYTPKTEQEIMGMCGIREVCYYKCKRELIELIKSGEWPYSWPEPKIYRDKPIYEQKVKEMRGGLWNTVNT